MEEIFFEVEDLSKSFGNLQVVNQASFHIDRDEIIGLIGPNGAGKTTLIRLIMGFLKPTEGSVSFKGRDITMLPTSRLKSLPSWPTAPPPRRPTRSCSRMASTSSLTSCATPVA